MDSVLNGSIKGQLFLNSVVNLYFGVPYGGIPGQRPAYATTSHLTLWVGMTIRPAIKPLSSVK